MKRQTTVMVGLLLLISMVAMSAYEFVAPAVSGTSDYKVALDEPRRDVQVFAPDDDLKFSIWRYHDESWERIYPVTGLTPADTQYTAYAGYKFVHKGGAKGDVICIDRTDATRVQVLAQ